MASPRGFVLPRAKTVGRDDFLVSLARGKQVLHLGCVDHPLLDERLRTGQLLHQKLAGAATKLWGVDLDAEGIRKLREEHRIADLLVCDAEHLEAVASIVGRVDLVVAGEILEHVHNPGLVLKSVHAILASHGTLVVTVPNALGLRVWLHGLRGRESVHPEHVAYFSPYTTYNVLQKLGFDVEELLSYWYPSTRRGVNLVKQLVVGGLTKRLPFMGDGVIAVARRR